MQGQRGKEVGEALLTPRRVLPAHLLLPVLPGMRPFKNGNESKWHSCDVAERKVTTVDHAPEVAFSIASALQIL
jgi:hypothetical protein